MKRLVAIMLLLLGVCFLQSANADVLVHLETTMGQSERQVGEMFVSADKVRMNNAGRENRPDMIFRGDRQLMMTIDPVRKEMVTITQADLKKLGDSMNSAMRSLNESLSKAPPQQRAMMEQMMGAMMQQMRGNKKSPATIKATGQKKTISGFPCEQYVVQRDGVTTREYWTASPSSVPGGEELRGAFEAMGGFFKELLNAVSEGPMANMIDNPYSEFAQVKGIPILSREISDGKVQGETLITALEKKSFEGKVFEAPTGYASKSITEGLKGLPG